MSAGFAVYNPIQDMAYRPICARCDKQVDEVTWWNDHQTRYAVFKVTCHNQVIQHLVTEAELEGMHGIPHVLRVPQFKPKEFHELSQRERLQYHHQRFLEQHPEYSPK